MKSLAVDFLDILFKDSFFLYFRNCCTDMHLLRNYPFGHLAAETNIFSWTECLCYLNIHNY
jgi:hypothetical protein